VAYQAEYIWLDGYEPTPMLRSKTKILADDVTDPPIWGFDGSSTEQATGDKSDCVLRPVFTCPDPIRGGQNILVMCEVLLASNMRPHPSNTRAACARVEKKFAADEMLFGLEQEYTMLRPDGTPLGFPPGGGQPRPQGPYYCGVGTGRIMGRDIVEEHTQACIDAGLMISGTNPEVMPGQWEFQVGPLGPTAVGDQLNVARWLLHRIAEDYDVVISLDAKPEKGDWNGAGCHTNFSNKAMRGDYKAIINACEAIGKNYMDLVLNYGDGIQDRLTGKHETAPWDKFSYGVSDRGASVRIPWQVERDGKGYAEDRRPNANCDPYIVAKMITEIVCGSTAKGARKR
jgi:glutamine synthetase